MAFLTTLLAAILYIIAMNIILENQLASTDQQLQSTTEQLQNMSKQIQTSNEQQANMNNLLLDEWRKT